jgi:hypothetical protein
MSRRYPAIAIVVGCFAIQAAAADRAVRRDGGSGSSQAGARQPSSQGSGASASSGGSSHRSGGDDASHGSFADRSDRGRSSRTLTAAQRRQPRPGTGTGGSWRRASRYGYYWDPGFYGYGFGYGYYGGWWPYGGYGYYGGGYYPHGGVYHYYRDDRGALRLLVDPSKARVYVDGYYAGVVDDFDGLFQRLHVSPGRHDISLKLEGYQPHRMKVYVGAGSTLKLHYDLQKGDGPETVEDMVGPAEERLAQRRSDDRFRRYSRADREPPEDDDAVDAPAEKESGAPTADLGRLRLTVRPEDASVYVDGQFKGSGRQAGSIELPAGRHRIEVVRPGYRTHERDVEIDSGTTREVEVELPRS